MTQSTPESTKGSTTSPLQILTATDLPPVSPVRMRSCPGCGVGGAASAGGRRIGMEHATLPQSHSHGLLAALPPYTNIEDFSHLSKYVRTHFSGDWAAYTAFVHWADSQRLEFPYEPVHNEAWLSLKTPTPSDINPLRAHDVEYGASAHTCHSTIRTEGGTSALVSLMESQHLRLRTWR